MASDFDELCAAYQDGVRARKNETAVRAGMAAALRRMRELASESDRCRMSMYDALYEGFDEHTYNTGPFVAQSLLNELLRQSGSEAGQ